MATINGTDLNDTLNGTSEGDAINGLGGDDTINAGTRPPEGDGDYVVGGAGVDTLVVDASAESQSVSLFVGGAPHFLVRSTSHNFFVDAYDVEKVSFTGGSGDDSINTADGGVSVNGGGGIDWWLADYSASLANLTFALGVTTSLSAVGLSSILDIEKMTLTTGSGNDTIAGGAQGDIVNTGAGNDTVDMKTRPAVGDGDIWIGGTGIDTLVVDATAEAQGVSLFVGGAPSYLVRSTSGNFFVDAYDVEKVKFTGGAGDDSINSGNGAITIQGNGGIDSWIANYSALTANIAFTLGTTTALAPAGLSSILGIERIDLTTGSGNDTIVGGAQADVINTGAGSDTVDMKTRPTGGNGDVWLGGAGTDTLVVDASAETQGVSLSIAGSPTYVVRSTSGNFSVDAYDVEKVKFIGGSGDDSINSGTGGITIDGGAGIDLWIANFGAINSNIAYTLGTSTTIPAGGATLILNIEAINLTTGNGNDNIVGGAQADTLVTGNGNDTANLGTRPVSGGGDVWDGGAGSDTLVVDASADTQGVSLNSGGAPSYLVRSTSGLYSVDAYNVEHARFTGGAGDDYINTGGGGTVVDGGGGVDWWLADYSAATQRIVFRLGSSTAIGVVNLDSIANVERISLTTGSGNDIIKGANQADTIVTGAGNDSIDAGVHPFGGAGDFVDGGDGNDTLVVDATAETLGVQLFAGGSPSFSVRSTSGNFFVDAYNVESAVFSGGSGNDNATGGGFSDDLTGGAGDDILSGGGAGDALTGNAGKDTLSGDDGNDTLDGGKDADLLRGGTGADTLTGGGQADVFDYDVKNDSNLANTDTITDFQVGLDDVNLADLDANTQLGGHQTFIFIGTATFSGLAGELRAVAGAVEADLNGDGAADFRILIANNAQLGVGDFILS